MPLDADAPCSKITGVLLAAGAGTRFGMPKALADDGAWVVRGVDALRGGGCDRVVVVLGAAPTVSIPDTDAVIADDWAHGLSRSVAAGLAACESDVDSTDVILTVVDTPDVNARCVRRVIEVGVRAPSGIARATYRGEFGHPVYVASRHLPSLVRAVRDAPPIAADRGLGPHFPSDTALVECGDLATGRDIDVLPHSEVPV